VRTLWAGNDEVKEEVAGFFVVGVLVFIANRVPSS
jgi:hypothetical protein